MKKGIEIDGEIDKKGTTAHTLNVQSAIEGKSFVEYIRLVLNDKAKSLNKSK
jgi:hypothetical protein